ncbi:hypothetical protein B484DRAFT_441088, partial [Ochromonadaceae sp. CCMP2298]
MTVAILDDIMRDMMAIARRAEGAAEEDLYVPLPPLPLHMLTQHTQPAPRPSHPRAQDGDSGGKSGDGGGDDADNESVCLAPGAGVTLLTQFYHPPGPKQQHVWEALRNNLQNPFVGEVVLLNEQWEDFSHLPNTFKIRQVLLGERLTFRKAFEFANNHLEGHTVALANSDIYFDVSLRRLTALMPATQAVGTAAGTAGTRAPSTVLPTEVPEAQVPGALY